MTVLSSYMLNEPIITLLLRYLSLTTTLISFHSPEINVSYRSIAKLARRTLKIYGTSFHHTTCEGIIMFTTVALIATVVYIASTMTAAMEFHTEQELHRWITAAQPKQQRAMRVALMHLKTLIETKQFPTVVGIHALTFTDTSSNKSDPVFGGRWMYQSYWQYQRVSKNSNTFPDTLTARVDESGCANIACWRRCCSTKHKKSGII